MRPPSYLLLLLVLILDLVYGRGNGGGSNKGGKNAEKCVSGHCLKPG